MSTQTYIFAGLKNIYVLSRILLETHPYFNPDIFADTETDIAFFQNKGSIMLVISALEQVKLMILMMLDVDI